MKHEQRIPTIVGLLVLFISITATIVLFRNIRGLMGEASQDLAPIGVKITNLSENGFSASWITTMETSGTVNYGETLSVGNIAIDDRDQGSNITGQYQTHHVTVRYLKPSSKYYFKIISGGQSFDKNDEPYIVTTTSNINQPSSSTRPIYGTVIKPDKNPAGGSIVYLNIPQAAPVSTLVKSSGSWLIPLNNIRTADLSQFMNFNGSEILEIFIQANNEETSQATIKINSEPPVPEIILGKKYNFIQNQTSGLTPVAEGGFKSITDNPNSSSAAAFSPSLINPTSDAAIPSNQPRFEGTGVPGKPVVIKVESDNPITGSTNVNQNGSWSWTPPTGLSPGTHKVTVTTTDNSGNSLQFIRSFTVLAAGTSVNESATPAASLKPSPTPIPKPTPTLKPIIIATSSTAPASGNLTPTIFLIFSGLIMLSFGLGRIIFVKIAQNA